MTRHTTSRRENGVGQVDQDIHNKLKQKDDALSTANRRYRHAKAHNGAIFVQTISDYPLVEAISQNVVKHPVLPDAASERSWPSAKC
jgi:type III restriction enzyme